MFDYVLIMYCMFTSYHTQEVPTTETPKVEEEGVMAEDKKVDDVPAEVEKETEDESGMEAWDHVPGSVSATPDDPGRDVPALRDCVHCVLLPG